MKWTYYIEYIVTSEKVYQHALNHKGHANIPNENFTQGTIRFTILIFFCVRKLGENSIPMPRRKQQQRIYLQIHIAICANQESLIFHSPF